MSTQSTSEENSTSQNTNAERSTVFIDVASGLFSELGYENVRYFMAGTFSDRAANPSSYKALKVDRKCSTSLLQ